MGNEVTIRITADNDTGPGAAAARAEMTKLGNDLNTSAAASGTKAGDSLGGGVAKGSDRGMGDTRSLFSSLGQDIDSTLSSAGTSAGGHLGGGISHGSSSGLRDTKSLFSSLGGDIESDMGQAGEKAGTSLGGSMASGASGMVGDIGPQTVALIAGGVVLGGPLIAGAMSAVTVGGVLAAGAALQRNSPVVLEAWNGLIGDLGSEATQASSVMAGPIADALDEIKANLQSEGPAFQSMFSGAAQDIPILTQGIDGLVDNSLPGLQAMVSSSQPIMKGLASAAGAVGSGISDVAEEVAANSGLIGQDLSDMGGDVKNLIDVFGDLTVVGSQLFHELSPEITGITKALSVLGDAAIVVSHGFDGGSGAKALVDTKVGAVAAGDAAENAANKNKDLAASGGAVAAGLSEAQSSTNTYATGLQALVKAQQGATAGAAYVEDSTDKASIAAGQGVQSWHQLQAAVGTAQQGYEQAAQGVSTAEHAVEQASEGVAQARHSEVEAALAVTQAQEGYTEAVYQEQQAQLAVTAARAAAEQQLISLKLQADDAGTSALSAGDALFQATQNASKLGVNPGNAKQIATEPETAGNQAQVEAAIALLQAENQVADAQNSSKQAQSALNTARRQGVDGNPAVLTAEHSLTQAQQGVQQAAQGVADAHYAQQQATLQVANAEYGLQQASRSVTTAENAENQAAQALTTARDNESRSLDQNTLVGATNRQSLINIYNAYLASTGSSRAAAIQTEITGDKMGYTAGQVQNVIKHLDGLDGTSANFSLTGTPSLNIKQLEQVSSQIGLGTLGSIGPALTTGGVHLRRAAGGPGGGLTWVGEQGPELVSLPYGSEVIPSANSKQRALLGEVSAPRHANGGPVGAADLSSPVDALALNLPMAAQWGAFDAIGQALWAMGGPKLKLPAAGQIDLGTFAGGGGGGFGGGSHVSGNRAANKAIMQSVFARHGWGSGPAWAAQDYLEMREAGYDNFAQNPTSTAFGMGQFLNSTWGAYGYQKTSDPTVQSEAMAAYEGARYGGPIGAANHERAVNWYGNGGVASGLIGVGEHGRELVKVPTGSTVYPAANVPSMTGGPGTGAPLQLQISAGADSQFGTFMRNLFRTGVIQLKTADGKQVQLI